MSAPRVWDGQYDYLEPQAQTAFCEALAGRGTGVLARRSLSICRLRGNRDRGWLGQASRDAFWALARIFCAATDCLEFLEPSKPWVMSISYREGAGIYVEFKSMAGGATFALDQEGCIATPDFPDCSAVCRTILLDFLQMNFSGLEIQHESPITRSIQVLSR